MHLLAISMADNCSSCEKGGLFCNSRLYYCYAMGSYSTFIPNILRNLVLSYLSDENQKDYKERLVSNLIKANLIIVSALVVLFGIASPIIASLYGQEFLNLKYVLAIALLVTLPDCVSYVLMQEYISSCKTWALFYFRLIRDGGFFASIIILSLIIF